MSPRIPVPKISQNNSTSSTISGDYVTSKQSRSPLITLNSPRNSTLSNQFILPTSTTICDSSRYWSHSTSHPSNSFLRPAPSPSPARPVYRSSFVPFPSWSSRLFSCLALHCGTSFVFPQQANVRLQKVMVHCLPMPSESVREDETVIGVGTINRLDYPDYNLLFGSCF